MMTKKRTSNYLTMHAVLLGLCFLMFSSNFLQSQVIMSGAENMFVIEGTEIFHDGNNTISFKKVSVEQDPLSKNLGQMYVADGTTIFGLDSAEEYAVNIASIEKPKTKDKPEKGEPKDKKDITKTEDSSVRNQTIFRGLDDYSIFQSYSHKVGYFAIVSSGSNQSKKHIAINQKKLFLAEQLNSKLNKTAFFTTSTKVQDFLFYCCNSLRGPPSSSI